MNTNLDKIRLFKLMRYYSYGWDDLSDDDIVYFTSKEEAQADLNDYMQSYLDAHKAGFVDDVPLARDYKIEPVYLHEIKHLIGDPNEQSGN